MKSHFEVTFPLILEHGDTFKMTFSLKEGEERLDFRKGLYFFYGDNGAGKTTFFNLLGLTAGRIGKKRIRRRAASGFAERLITKNDSIT